MNLSEVRQCFWVGIFLQARAYDRITAAEKWLNISTNSSQTVGVVRLFLFNPPLKVRTARLRMTLLSKSCHALTEVCRGV